MKKITLKLLKDSDSNDDLTTLLNMDNQNGAGIVPLAIKDLSGRTTLICDQAWIAKKPNVVRSNNASDGNTEWTIYAVVPEDAFIVGGHS